MPFPSDTDALVSFTILTFALEFLLLAEKTSFPCDFNPKVNIKLKNFVILKELVVF